VAVWGALSFTQKSEDLRPPCQSELAVGGALSFTQKSEDLQPPCQSCTAALLFFVEDSRWGVCWRVGFPRGLFPPLWCFPPRCLGAVPPPVPLSRVAASFPVSVFHLLWRPGAWPTSRPPTYPILCVLLSCMCCQMLLLLLLLLHSFLLTSTSCVCVCVSFLFSVYFFISLSPRLRAALELYSYSLEYSWPLLLFFNTD